MLFYTISLKKSKTYCGKMSENKNNMFLSYHNLTFNLKKYAQELLQIFNITCFKNIIRHILDWFLGLHFF